MRVYAKETGFYGGSRRRKGTEFEVPDGAAAKWFEPVEKRADAEKRVIPASGLPPAKLAYDPADDIA